VRATQEEYSTVPSTVGLIDATPATVDELVERILAA